MLLITANRYIMAQNKSCCDESSAPKTMAAFGNDEKFRNAHPTPVSFTLSDALGKMITFNTSDGKTGNAYEIKNDKNINNWIFIFHEWYGLNDYIKKESDELFTALGNVNILAIDLYDGKVAANSDDAGKYVQAVEIPRSMNIIRGAADYCGKDAVFGTLGWCFGGSWSNQASILLEEKCKASVIYYGMPETDTVRLNKISAPVLGIFGEQDKWVNPDVVAKFEENMKSLNKTTEIKSYDAVHGFANPSNPKHDIEATKEAKQITLDFFRKYIK